MIVVLYLRALIFLVLFPTYTALCSLAVMLTSLFFNSRKVNNHIMRLWATLICQFCGVRVHTRGYENIPTGGCVFLFNHTSFFDIFAIFSTIPDVRFGAKIELFKIPFFGQAMKIVGILPIDRAKREKVYQHYDESKSRIEAGERFVLAPEGTRQKEEVLAPFKAGPFIFAINSKAPIVPVVIRGAAVIWPTQTYLMNLKSWRSEITVDILSPISTVNETLEGRNQLQQKVHAVMSPYFKTTHSD